MSPRDDLPSPLAGVARGADAVPVAPSMSVALDAIHAPVPRPVVDARVVWVSALAAVLGVCTALVARGLGDCIAWTTNAAFYGRSSFAPASPAGNHLGFFVDPRPGRGRNRGRRDGALRIGGDPRARDPRGDGAGALQREPHPRAAHVPEAAVGRDCHRHRRPVRRRGADHRNRRRARFARRAASARLGRRAKDAARRRGGRGNVGHVRGAGQRGAPGRRAPALRVPRSLARAGRARERRGLRDAHRHSSARRRRSRCRPSRRRRRAALAVYVVDGARHGAGVDRS